MRNPMLSAAVILGMCRMISLFVLLGSLAIGASASISVSVTTSLPSPQPVNTAITLTASATGGTNVQYQFWGYNPNTNPAWQQLQAYSNQNSYSWTPAVPGNYLLSITAQDGADGTEANTTLWYGISGPALTAVSLTTDQTSPQPVNTTITLTASATGGTDVQYQFWLYNPNASPAWNQLQGYSNQNSCSWTPTVPGNYLLSVTALDGVTGAEVNNLLWFGISGPALTAVSITTDQTSPQPVNTTITLTASATGGTVLQYQFWVYNPNASPGMEPIASLFHPEFMFLDTHNRWQLPSLRHRTGRRNWCGS